MNNGTVSSLTRKPPELGPDTPSRPRPTPASPETSSAGGAHTGLDTWHRRLARRVMVTDLVAVGVATGLAQYLRFGVSDPAMRHAATSVAFVVIWMAALEWTHSREAMVLGGGPEEFRRVCRAAAVPFVLVALADLWLKLDIARGYLAVALAAGSLFVVCGRLFWRHRLARWRRRGVGIQRVVILGGDDASLTLATDLSRDRTGAVAVVGLCIPGFTGTAGEGAHVSGRVIPILGDELDLIDAVTTMSADVVAVTVSEAAGSEHLREIGWVLNDLGVRLMVAPGILDVSEPRIRIAPVADTSMIHIKRPRYRGASRLGKVVFDRVGALLAIMVLAPVLLTIAAAVVLSSRGPALYASERIGAGGRPFRMFKFRSMYTAADEAKADLEAENVGAGPLFKLQHDPRVTPLGRIIRPYSLDELPQLFNVALGQMSLVGPRPHLGCEVASYSTSVQRRMLVRPGMTGLWQVSGRSDLDWQESVRLDLKYVENWSFLLDVYILLRTVRAVVSKEGAY